MLAESLLGPPFPFLPSMNINVMSGAVAALLTTWDSHHEVKVFILATGGTER